MQICDDLGALRGVKNFGQHFAHLRSENTEPDFVDFVFGAPEFDELAEVVGAVHHLRGDRAVDSDLLAGDVLDDALVRGGCAADVVLRLKAVDGDNNINERILGPRDRERAEGTGDDLYVNAAFGDLGN